ncbi:nitronate monooxygenase [Peribacillus sp. SI8-4]|uniref:NAD(P)H-dependent flavin oxidoreductase n=1 Tax=Peribacillus sp. SI8-4 TaxID=3048009 RepID=UPI0025555CDF|nr:nitronate monooxygenase [Peribacillus sp. SI8-4]
MAEALLVHYHWVVRGASFMATKEAPIHDHVKDWLVSANELDTVVIQRRIGSPSRVAWNAVSKEVDRLENKGAAMEDLIPLITGHRSKKVYVEGDLDGGIWSCGQSAGLIKDVLTVDELIKQIIREVKSSLAFIQTRLESFRT